MGKSTRSDNIGTCTDEEASEPDDTENQSVYTKRGGTQQNELIHIYCLVQSVK